MDTAGRPFLLESPASVRVVVGSCSSDPISGCGGSARQQAQCSDAALLSRFLQFEGSGQFSNEAASRTGRLPGDGEADLNYARGGAARRGKAGGEMGGAPELERACSERGGASQWRLFSMEGRMAIPLDGRGRRSHPLQILGGLGPRRARLPRRGDGSGTGTHLFSTETERWIGGTPPAP